MTPTHRRSKATWRSTLGLRVTLTRKTPRRQPHRALREPRPARPGGGAAASRIVTRVQPRPVRVSRASPNIASRQIVSAGRPVGFMRNSASATRSSAARSRAVAPAPELTAKAVLFLEEDRRPCVADRLLDRSAVGDAGGEQCSRCRWRSSARIDRNRRFAFLEDAGRGAVERGGVALGGGQERVVERQRGAVGDRRRARRRGRYARRRRHKAPVFRARPGSPAGRSPRCWTRKSVASRLARDAMRGEASRITAARSRAAVGIAADRGAARRVVEGAAQGASGRADRRPRRRPARRPAGGSARKRPKSGASASPASRTRTTRPPAHQADLRRLVGEPRRIGGQRGRGEFGDAKRVAQIGADRCAPALRRARAPAPHRDRRAGPRGFPDQGGARNASTRAAASFTSLGPAARLGRRAAGTSSAAARCRGASPRRRGFRASFSATTLA